VKDLEVVAKEHVLQNALVVARRGRLLGCLPGLGRALGQQRLALVAPHVVAVRRQLLDLKDRLGDAGMDADAELCLVCASRVNRTHRQHGPQWIPILSLEGEAAEHGVLLESSRHCRQIEGALVQEAVVHVILGL
jgi:hypothetical protein